MCKVTLHRLALYNLGDQITRGLLKPKVCLGGKKEEGWGGRKRERGRERKRGGRGGERRREEEERRGRASWEQT